MAAELQGIEKHHQKAIESTKKQIHTNILEFIEHNETAALDEYLQKRALFLDKVWSDIWKQRLVSSYSRSEKMEYLRSMGIEVDELSLNQLKKSFYQVLAHFEPFDAAEWVRDEYEETWVLITQNMQSSKKKQKQKQMKRSWNKQFLLPAVSRLLEEKYLYFYLYVRKYAGKRLEQHLNSGVRFTEDESGTLHKAGAFHPEYYSMVASFLTEFTGRTAPGYPDFDDWTHETYWDAYYELILSYVTKDFKQVIFAELPKELGTLYEQQTGEEWSYRVFQKSKDINLLLEDCAESFFREWEEDIVDSVLTTPQTPEEINEAWEQFEQKRREEKERAKREKAERKNRIAYIFGEEYEPAQKVNTRYILHFGDTNTGKTYTALERLKACPSGLYLAPLRLLALEVYEKLNKDGIPCDLKTGEEEKRTEGAAHASSTVEMFQENRHYDIVVIDEAQMIADKERGFSWFRSITKANAREVHIIGSPNVKELILGLLGEEADVEVREYKRELPLLVRKKSFRLKDVQKGDALVAFSRKRVLEIAGNLEGDGHKVSVIYGNMPPESRQRQMENFNAGATHILVATDAIGMGLNLPIKRIILMSSQKFDGKRRRELTTQEVKQIAGRAGRKGLYEQGEVVFMENPKRMKRLLEGKDVPIQVFTVAPTHSVLERFKRYYKDLGLFFELWKEFQNPKGTKKASLAQEEYLYSLVRGTAIEQRFSMEDLYSYLQIPFSAYEDILADQWKQVLMSLVNRTDMPDPFVQKETLEELELSYKSVELHLMFLYRLNKPTEAYYWERVKKEIADDIHYWLSHNMKAVVKKCRQCGRKLDWDYPYSICQACYDQGQPFQKYGNRR